MTPRRDQGTGTIYRHGSGYRGQLRYIDPETKKPRRASFTGKTKAEVRSKILEARVKLAAKDPVIEARDTLAAAVEAWKPVAWAGLKPTTVNNMNYLVDRRLVAELGHLRLRDIDERVILAWQDRLIAEGLSPATVQKARQLLVAVLDKAVERGELRRNKARAVNPPRCSSTEQRWYTSEEVTAILDASAGDRVEALLAFIAHTGLRKGEALALTWDDIDGAKASIRGTLARVDGKLIVQTPKTKSSVRRVDLTGEAIAALDLARTQQDDDQAASRAWRSTGFVFTTESGEPIDPRNALRSFTRIRNVAGISDGSIHSLRHGFATHLLLAGTPVEVVSKHLGHSRTSITMDVYSHATEDDRSEAIARGSAGFGRRSASNTGKVVRMRRNAS